MSVHVGALILVLLHFLPFSSTIQGKDGRIDMAYILFRPLLSRLKVCYTSAFPFNLGSSTPGLAVQNIRTSSCAEHILGLQITFSSF